MNAILDDSILVDPFEPCRPSYFTTITTYLGFSILYVFGYVEDFTAKFFRLDSFKDRRSQRGYAPLLDSFDDFFTRKFKSRIDDCFARPSTGIPGANIELINVPSKWKRAQSVPHFSQEKYLNMGSYNYLDLVTLPTQQAEAVELVVRTIGTNLAIPQQNVSHRLRLDVEASIAEFIGKPAAVVCSMGFAMNLCAIEALMGPSDLILSDELNHASIRVASRMCGAKIMSFKHNNMKSLERRLRDQISTGRFSRIMVVVEGLYSMEGTLCDLPALVRLRKKYRFYLFVDEAHSIGALGRRGRGVCEHFDISPNQVDVLMGTFSKSFGAVGGYIAADHDVTETIRQGTSMISAEQPTPAVLAQIHGALETIRSPRGVQKIRQLKENTIQLREGLHKMGLTVIGHAASPVVPILIYQLGKVAAFSREMLERNIAVVVVGYPATPLHSARARLCVSAGHTTVDIDRFLHGCDEIAQILMLKHRR